MFICKKKPNQPSLIHCITNSKLTKCKTKNCNYFRRKFQKKNLCDLVFGKEFLGITPKERKKVKSLSSVQLFVTPWTVAYQASPSMGFSRQEYWSGLPFPSPGDLPDTGIEPRSPTLQADALPSVTPKEPSVKEKTCQNFFSGLRLKNQATDGKDVFENSISDKGLIARIHKELSKLNNEKPNNLFFSQR